MCRKEERKSWPGDRNVKACPSIISIYEHCEGLSQKQGCGAHTFSLESSVRLLFFRESCGSPFYCSTVTVHGSFITEKECGMRHRHPTSRVESNA